MGEDDERPNGQASQAEEPDIDADTMALELWQTVGFTCASFFARTPYTVSQGMSCRLWNALLRAGHGLWTGDAFGCLTF